MGALRGAFGARPVFLAVRLLCLTLCLGTLPALAAAEGSSAALVEISPRSADRFGALWVQSSQGRIQPVDTYASELLRKIYHRDRYGSLDAGQVLLAWLGDPSRWARVPLIYLPDRELRERFGAEGKHVAFDRFFDEHGHYLLAAQIEAAYAKPAGERNKAEKELVKVDEKINILHALFSGRMLAVFPADSGRRWYSSGEQMPELSGQDSLFAAAWMSRYLGALRRGDTARSDSLVGALERWQRTQTVALGLDDRRKEAELLYNRADFFRTAFRAYLVLGLLYVLSFFVSSGRERLRRRLLRVLGWAVLAVFLWQTAGMGLRWYISGRAPWTNAYESMVYVGWSTVLAGLIFVRRSPLVLALGTLMGGVILFVSNLNWLDPQITPLVPVLRSPWLMIHVSVITASYGFFGISALCGLGTLGGILCGRPNRELRIVGEMTMIIGLVLLTAGIFFGAIWANESWGRYWGWDPKETWALITMLFYAFVLHSRFIPALNNEYAFSVFSVAGIYTVLMTFFGVNYLLSGLHSYGHSGGLPLGMVGGVTLLVVLLMLGAGWRLRRRG